MWLVSSLLITAPRESVQEGYITTLGISDTGSFLGVDGAVKEEIVLYLALDSFSLSFVLMMRLVLDVPRASNFLTLLATGTKGNDLARDSFLFNSSFCKGEASLLLDFLEVRVLSLSRDEVPGESSLWFLLLSDGGVRDFSIKIIFSLRSLSLLALALALVPKVSDQ